MSLLKSGRFVDDPWVHWDDEQSEPPEGPVIVSLKRWREDKSQLLARGTLLGLKLSSEQTPGEVHEDLPHFDVIALDFPVFTDGRSYSNARRLRQRYGYKGEVRAVGEVLRDQYLAFVRCGFDALEVSDDETEEGYQAAISAISTPFQPALDQAPTAMSLRQRRMQG